MKFYEEQYRVEERRYYQVTGSGDTEVSYKYFPMCRKLLLGIGWWEFMAGFRPSANYGHTSFPTQEKCEQFFEKALLIKLEK